MADYLQELFSIQPIIGITINTVPTSIHLAFIVYGVFFLSLLISLYIYFFRKKITFINALRRSFIVALISGSIIWWINGEVIWFSWLKDHWKHFKGLNTEEKLLTMEYPLYDFALRLKKLIPEDSPYTIYSSDEYYSKRLEYFLLPRKEKDPSEFIIVIVDKESVFDPFKGVLKRGDKVITGLEPFFYYAEDAYMVRRR
jgi:hypothetical protein